MRSFVDLDRTFANQPPALGAVLARIDTARGREQLFADQLPELLQALSANARIASITASNAIEGVTVDTARAARIAEGGRRYRSRNEKEFAGYRDAIDGLLREGNPEPPDIPFVLHLHRQLFQHSGGRGGYLKTEDNYIASYDSGRREVIFTPPTWQETEFLLAELFARYRQACTEQSAHPLILVGAMVLDFLAIHPVADGNGRVARLLTTHELLRHGYGVARYVSVEQRIYESKNAYYASLYDSQRDWRDGAHTIWPWVEYLAAVLADSYEDFEARVTAASRTAGSKQERVREHIRRHAPAQFRKRDLERALPGISAATIRLVLNEMRDSGEIVLTGSGPGATWQRLSSAPQPLSAVSQA